MSRWPRLDADSNQCMSFCLSDADAAEDARWGKGDLQPGGGYSQGWMS